MNCETADNLLMDELYGELDDATSAEVRRHAADCDACGLGDALAKMKRTREIAAPPYVEPPADLEDRILAATRDARPVIPMRRKVGGIVSLAGAWAMRPQTAMAAVFLLMIGSSLTFLKTHRSKSAASSAVAVSEQGAPVELSGKLSGMAGGSASASPIAAEDKDEGSVALAQRDLSPTPAAAATSMPAAASVPASSPQIAMAAPMTKAPRSFDNSELESNAFSSGGGSGDPSVARHSASGRASPKAFDGASAALKNAPYDAQYGNGLGQSMGPSSATQAAPPAAAAPGAAPAPIQQSGATAAATGDQSQAAASDPMATGMAAYRAHRYDDALQSFDSVASGDVRAALMAARTVRDASGCAAAVGRYDDVASRAPSSSVGYDAKLEAARCYRSMGDNEAARSRLLPLLTVPSHADRAKAELAAIAPQSSRPPAAQKATRAF